MPKQHLVMMEMKMTDLHLRDAQTPDRTHRNQVLDIRNDAGDEDDGLYTFPLSSEAPYSRWRGNEVLVHTKDAVDLSFLNSGTAPLLVQHDQWSGQVGVIVKAWLDEKSKRVYVTARFSNNPRPQEIKRDVDDGIMRNVSVGYNINRDTIIHDEHKEGETPTYRVMNWKPMEASIVSIPADETVGVGREHQPQEGTMPATNPTGATPEGTQTRTGGLPSAAPTDEQRAEQMEAEINEISTLASEHNEGTLGRSFIEGEIRAGRVPSLAAFRGVMRANLPADTPLVNTDIGMSEDDTRNFSVLRAMRAVANDDWSDAGFEREAMTAAEANSERGAQYGGIMLPTDLMGRWGDFQMDGVNYRDNRDQVGDAIRAALGTGGNANILTTSHLAQRFIDNLRNNSAFLQAGATMLTGLTSDVEIPGGDQNIAAAWLAAEDADVAESNPTFRKVELSPHDLGAYTDVTRRMLQQGTIDMEAYIRMQMADASRIAIDMAIGYGSGASGIPEGISNTTGIGSVTFAAATPTRGEIIDLRTAIADTNRGRGVTYIGNSSMVGALQQTKVDAGSGIFLMGDSAERLVGNRFIESNQVTDGDLFAGVFDDVLIGMWGGIELARSTEAKFLSGGLRFRVIQTVDVDFQRVGSFALGNDGA